MEPWIPAHREIERRVRAGRAALARELTLGGLLRSAAVLLAGFAAGVLLHLVVHPGTAVAWGMSLAALGFLAYAAVRFLAAPLIARPDDDRFVEWLDARHPADRNIIVSAWQLGRQANVETHYAPDLVAAVVDRGAAAARRVDVAHWRDRATDRRWWIGGAVSLALLALLGLAAGPDRFGRAAGRVLDPRRAAPEPIGLAVTPGNLTIERGDDVELTVRVTGTDRTPVLRIRESGGIWMTRRLEGSGGDGGGAASGGSGAPGAARTYAGLLRHVERDQEYLVAVEKTESPTWRIQVNEPPRVAGFEITYFYPDYTGRPSETVTTGSGDLAALVGTRVRLKVLANRKMDSAWMDSGPAGAASLPTVTALDPADELNWESRFTIAGEPREFAIRLRDARGVDRFTSPRFRIDPVDDRPPVVRLLSPDRDIPIPEAMRLDLESEGVDDYGLSRLDLVYSIREGVTGRLRLRDFPAGSLEFHGTFPWDLVPLNLFPGNEVTYYLELFDNDRVSGPKSSRSEVRHLRFPTVDELYAEVQEEHGAQIDTLSAVLGGAKELKEQLEKLSRETKRGGEMSWEKKKEIESLLQRQAELEKKVSDAARDLQDTMNKAREQTLISPELLQKMQELSDLMQSIQNPKIRDSLNKLNDALQKMDKDAVQKALENFKLDQAEMMKSVDRTIEMLKELRKEELLEDAVRRSEELAREQQDLAREAEKKPPEAADNPELAARQKELQDKADELAQKMDEMSRLAENEPELKKDLEEMKNSGQPQEMKKNMEKSREQLESGNREKALDFAFKAGEQAQELANGMKKAQSESRAARKRELQEKLMAVIQDLVDVSSAQEALLAGSSGLVEAELAVRQRLLVDGLMKSALELETLGKSTLFVNEGQTTRVGNALRRMNQATQDFSQGHKSAGVRNGTESAGDLNEGIVELMQSHSSMCNSGDPSGFMEQMQKMAGLSEQQEELNGQTRGSQSQGGNQRLSPQGRAEALEQLAARQEMIRRGLEDVAGQLGNRRDILGRLDDLAKEMADVADQLRKRNVDDRLLDRQDRILSRLLDAQKSVRRRDEKEERESRTAEQIPRSSPGPLSREQLLGPDRLRTDILRGQADTYPPQYRALVEQYFRALSERMGAGR